jgi:hypothetical protein
MLFLLQAGKANIYWRGYFWLSVVSPEPLNIPTYPYFWQLLLGLSSKSKSVVKLLLQAELSRRRSILQKPPSSVLMACFQDVTRPDGFFVATIITVSKMP